MTRLFAVLALCFIAACQLVETPSDDGGSVYAPVVETGATSPLILEQQCEAAGGTMVIGLAGPQCARPEPDAGKACSDNKECSGFCLAATRTCSPVTPYFGCHDVLQGGKSVGLCVD